MAKSRRQGGNSWFHLGRQPNAETLITDITKMSQFKRQFTEFGLDIDGEKLRSEAVRGNVDAAKSQSGQSWGSGPIGSEIYTTQMLDYIQAILNGDPKAKSTDVATTRVVPQDMALAAVDGAITFTKPTTPGQLEISLEGATGTVEVVGRRKTGLASYDVVPVKETVELGDDNKGTTEKSYSHVESLDLSNAGGDFTSAKKLNVIAKPGTKHTKFSARDEIFDSWTVQGNVGGVPRLAYGVVPVTARLDVGQNIRLFMETLARAVWRRRTVEGGVFTEKLSDDSDLSNNPFIPNVFFPHYGGYMELDGKATIFKDFQLNITQGLDFLEGSTGSPSRLPLGRGDAGRDVTATFSVYYESGDAATDDFIKWDERYRDNVISKLEIYMYYWTDDGKEYSQKVTLQEVELAAVPRIPVQGKGNLEENLSVRAVREGATAIVDWEIVDDAGWTAAA